MQRFGQVGALLRRVLLRGGFQLGPAGAAHILQADGQCHRLVVVALHGVHLYPVFRLDSRSFGRRGLRGFVYWRFLRLRAGRLCGRFFRFRIGSFCRRGLCFGIRGFRRLSVRCCHRGCLRLRGRRVLGFQIRGRIRESFGHFLHGGRDSLRASFFRHGFLRPRCAHGKSGDGNRRKAQQAGQSKGDQAMVTHFHWGFPPFLPAARRRGPCSWCGSGRPAG